MSKVLVNADHPISPDKREALTKQVADALSVLPEDVVFLPGVRVSIVDVPAEMTAARKKADDHAAKEKAAEEKAKAEAEEKAAKEAEKAAKEAEHPEKAAAEQHHSDHEKHRARIK